MALPKTSTIFVMALPKTLGVVIPRIEKPEPLNTPDIIWRAILYSELGMSKSVLNTYLCSKQAFRT